MYIISKEKRRKNFRIILIILHTQVFYCQQQFAIYHRYIRKFNVIRITCFIIRDNSLSFNGHRIRHRELNTRRSILNLQHSNQAYRYQISHIHER